MRGDLQPPSLPAKLVLTITLLFLPLSLLRGVDWAFIREPGTVSQLMLDNSVGLHTWGLALIAGNAALLAAYAARQHFPVWCGHGLLWAIYVGISLTTLSSVVDYGAGPGQLVAPLGAVIWHGAIALVMRPLPRRDGSTTGARAGH
ncbi:hypothetical protein [Nocardioides sp. Leaf374]|uniref:hypothetical protein n=1 Tax=Nocardioides sp. Leaf374 TaxID=2876560 RepID=UPI001E36EC53|nr:hypothetical protein [Nocardioides sp. Leaf374]